MIGNYEEPVQSNPTSHRQKQKRKKHIQTHKCSWKTGTANQNEQLFPEQAVIQLPYLKTAAISFFAYMYFLF